MYEAMVQWDATQDARECQARLRQLAAVLASLADAAF